jgi:adenylosuccinate synthase
MLEGEEELGQLIRERGREYGASTGRPRRCGWFDVPLLQYAATINGFDSFAVTKLDVLDQLETIPVCVGYRAGSKEVSEMPPTTKELEALRPVYECLPGWQVSTAGISRYEDLPSRARDYLKYLETRTGVEIGCISTGPERNHTILKPASRFEQLFR